MVFIWACCFVQRQSSVYLLVPDGTDSQFIVLMVIAFLLKLVHIIHLIVWQVWWLCLLAKALFAV